MLSYRKRPRRKPPALILTPLLDMFTIILVFLMVSFQSEDKDFVLSSDLTLPTSSARSPFKTAVNVAISKEAVKIEGKPIYALTDGRAAAEDLAAGKVAAISAAVKEVWENRTKEGDEENVVVIQADKSLPYQTIHLVTRSAAFAGFYRYRLVVEKE